MEISYYIHLFKRKIIAIVMIIILGTTAAAYLKNYLFQEEYEARVTFWLTNFISAQGLLATKSIFVGPELINDFKQTLLSKEFIGLWKDEAVKRVPRLAALDTNAIREKIVFEVNGDSRVFSVGFRDSDPRTAVIIAQIMAGSLANEVGRIFQIKRLTVIEDAVAASRVSPSAKKIIFFAGVFWTVIAVFLVLMIDMQKVGGDHEENLLD